MGSRKMVPIRKFVYFQLACSNNFGSHCKLMANRAMQGCTSQVTHQIWKRTLLGAEKRESKEIQIEKNEVSTIKRKFPSRV